MNLACHPLGPRVLARHVDIGRRARSSCESPPLAWSLCPEAWAEARLAAASAKAGGPNLGLAPPCHQDPVPAAPGARHPACPQGWGLGSLHHSLRPGGFLQAKHAWFQAQLCHSPIRCVTSDKTLPLSEPSFPPRRGANNSCWSGCSDDSERDGCGQSHLPVPRVDQRRVSPCPSLPMSVRSEIAP